MNLSWKRSGGQDEINTFTVSTVDISLPLLKHFLLGCKAKVQGRRRGEFFILLHTQIELENGFNISQAFFISRFSPHTLFPSHLCQMSFKSDWENMNGKEQNEGWDAASRAKGRRGNGCGIIRRAGTAGSIAKSSQKAGKGMGGEASVPKIDIQKSFLSKVLLTLGGEKRNAAMQRLVVFTG